MALGSKQFVYTMDLNRHRILIQNQIFVLSLDHRLERICFHLVDQTFNQLGMYIHLLFWFVVLDSCIEFYLFDQEFVGMGMVSM
jgi:hypothetical protein